MQPGGGGGTADARARRDKTIAGVLWGVASILLVVILVALLRETDEPRAAENGATTGPATATVAATTTVASTTTSTSSTTTTTASTTSTSTEPPTTTTEPPTTSTEPPTTTTEPPTTTTTEAPPTTTIPSNLMAVGEVEVSSEDPSGLHPGALALDGDRTTSWMANGNLDVTCVGFVCRQLNWASIHWRSPNGVDAQIAEIRILNNSQNADEALRTGHGFHFVRVIAYTSANGIVETFNSGEIPLDGDDQDVVLQPGVLGNHVYVAWGGYDDPGQMSGISELEIVGTLG